MFFFIKLQHLLEILANTYDIGFCMHFIESLESAFWCKDQFVPYSVECRLNVNSQPCFIFLDTYIDLYRNKDNKKYTCWSQSRFQRTKIQKILVFTILSPCFMFDAFNLKLIRMRVSTKFLGRIILQAEKFKSKITTALYKVCIITFKGGVQLIMWRLTTMFQIPCFFYHLGLSLFNEIRW